MVHAVESVSSFSFRSELQASPAPPLRPWSSPGAREARTADEDISVDSVPWRPPSAPCLGSRGRNTPGRVGNASDAKSDAGGGGDSGACGSSAGGDRDQLLEVVRLRKQVRQRDDLVRELQAAAQRREVELDAVRANLAARERELCDACEELRRYDDSLSQVHACLAERDAELAETRKLLHQREQEVVALAASTRDADERLARLQEAEQEADRVRLLLKQRDEEILASSSLVQRKEDELNKMRHEWQKRLQEEASRVRAEPQNEELLNAAREELELRESKISALQLSARQMQEELRALRAGEIDRVSISQSVGGYPNQGQSEDELAKARRAIEMRDSELFALRASTKQMEEEIASLRAAEHELLDKQSAQMQELLQHRDEELLSASASVRQAEAQLELMRVAAQAQDDNHLSEIRRHLEEKSAELDMLHATTRQSEEELLKLRSERHTQDTTLADMQIQLQRCNDELSYACIAQRTAEDEVTRLRPFEEETAVLKEIVKQRDSALAAASTANHAESDTRLAQAQGQMQQLSVELAQSHARIEHLVESRDRAQQQLERQEIDLKKAHENVECMERELLERRSAGHDHQQVSERLAKASLDLHARTEELAADSAARQRAENELVQIRSVEVTGTPRFCELLAEASLDLHARTEELAADPAARQRTENELVQMRSVEVAGTPRFCELLAEARRQVAERDATLAALRVSAQQRGDALVQQRAMQQQVEAKLTEVQAQAAEQVGKAERKVEELDVALTASRLSVEVKDEEIAELRRTQQQSETTLIENQTQATEELAKVRRQVEELNAELRECRDAAHTKEEAACTTLHTMQQEVAQVTEAQAQAVEQLEATRRQVEDLNCELAKTKSLLQGKETELVQLRTLQQEVSEAQTRAAEQLAEARRQVEVLELSLDASRNSAQEEREELVKLRSLEREAAANLSLAQTHATEELAQARQQLNDLDAALTVSSTSIRQKDEELEELRTVKHQLNARLTEAVSQLQQQQQQLATSSVSIDILENVRQQVEQKEVELVAFRTQAREQQEELIQSHLSAQHKLESNLADISLQLKQRTDELAEASVSLRLLEDELSHVRVASKDHDQLREQLKGAHQQVLQRDAEVITVQESLQNAQQEILALRANLEHLQEELASERSKDLRGQLGEQLEDNLPQNEGTYLTHSAPLPKLYEEPSELNHLTSQVELDEQLTEARKQLADKDEIIAASYHSLQLMEAELLRLRHASRSHSYTDEIADLRRRLEDREREVAASCTSARQIGEELAQMRRSLKHRERDLIKARKDLQKENVAKNDAVQRAEELTQLCTLLQFRNSDLSCSQDVLRQRDADLDELRAVLQQRDQELEKLRSFVKQQEEAFELEREEHEAELTELRASSRKSSARLRSRELCGDGDLSQQLVQQLGSRDEELVRTRAALAGRDAELAALRLRLEVSRPPTPPSTSASPVAAAAHLGAGTGATGDCSSPAAGLAHARLSLQERDMELRELRDRCEELEEQRDKEATDFAVFVQALAASSAGPAFSRTHDLTTAQLLGRGCYGHVLACRDRRSGELVVVKLQSQRWATVAMHEWSHGSEMGQHQNIVAYRDAVMHHDDSGELRKLLDNGYSNALQKGILPTTPSSCFLCMTFEYMDRGTLQHLMDHQRLCPVSIAAVTRQVASALAFMHARKRVHNDVKPENILLRSAGDHLVVKLADLGLANCSVDQRLDLDHLGYTTWCMGTCDKFMHCPRTGADRSRALAAFKEAAEAATACAAGAAAATEPSTLWAALALIVEGLWSGDLSMREVESAEALRGTEVRVADVVDRFLAEEAWRDVEHRARRTSIQNAGRPELAKAAGLIALGGVAGLGASADALLDSPDAAEAAGEAAGEADALGIGNAESVGGEVGGETGPGSERGEDISVRSEASSE
eukprot:TRINITY_DN5421_c0_g1_i1.p1 TRINITY_DN5421_c0_g1~~TRINITY_DN5421_c0_g1_i1.p1  ORF type:complete len:2036 (+),score=476.21 TRINITY_DN5421_c0_g1_i1:368-6109(+)